MGKTNKARNVAVSWWKDTSGACERTPENVLCSTSLARGGVSLSKAMFPSEKNIFIEILHENFHEKFSVQCSSHIIPGGY